MRENLVAIIFSVLSIVYLVLYARDRASGRQPPRRAWLRIGVIFAVISGVLWYLQLQA